MTYLLPSTPIYGMFYVAFLQKKAELCENRVMIELNYFFLAAQEDQQYIDHNLEDLSLKIPKSQRQRK